MKKIVLTIFCMLMLLSGCTGGKKEETANIAGKTFYDTADSFVYTERSRLWLGKDESFVLTDYYVGGMDEYSGAWTLKDGVVTLKAEDKEFKFEIQDENNLILRTSLTGANASDVFSTEKPNTEILPYGIEDFDYIIYYNAMQPMSNQSYIEIHDDKSFSLIEKGSNGVTEVNGLWSKEGNAYMFSNFDPFNDASGNKVYNFVFLINDENSLILNDDLDGSKKGDIFTTDGKVPAGYTKPDDTFAFKTQTFIHEPIQDVNEDYLPTITIATDFSFTFYENVYAGMGKYTGYCSPEQNGWACKVTDGSNMMGFNCGKNGEVACDVIKEIIFESADADTLILKTDLCMSASGDRFKLWKE